MIEVRLSSHWESSAAYIHSPLMVSYDTDGLVGVSGPCDGPLGQNLS